MKKLVLAVAALAWAGLASAGEYHVNQTLKCSDCHTMHASRSHQLGASGVDSHYPLSAQGEGHEALLTFATVNQTCLACHNGDTNIADVLGADAKGVTARSAGALNDIETVAEGYEDWMGHTLESTTQPPGYTGTAWGTVGLECSDCHSVHGNTSFRNLGARAGRGKSATRPSNWAISFKNDGIFDPSYDVTESGLRNYNTVGVKFGKGAVANYKGSATTSGNGMNWMCQDCHGNFHGASGATSGEVYDGTAFIRHPTTGKAVPTTGSAQGALVAGAQTDLVRPVWTDTTFTNYEPGCVTCHKGHGNKRGFALLYPKMTEGSYPAGGGAGTSSTSPGNADIGDYENGGATTVDGQYPINNLCRTCHSMGRSYRW